MTDTKTPTAGDALQMLEVRMDAMIRDGFHRARYVEGFPHDESQIVLPLNDPDTGDTLCVAALSVEDSGIGPALWQLALDMLNVRAALAAAPQPAQSIQAQRAIIMRALDDWKHGHLGSRRNAADTILNALAAAPTPQPAD